MIPTMISTALGICCADGTLFLNGLFDEWRSSAAYLTNIAYGPASAYGIATIQHIRRAIHVFRFFMGTGIMLRYLSVVPTLGFEITRRCGNEQLTENGKISIIT